MGTPKSLEWAPGSHVQVHLWSREGSLHVGAEIIATTEEEKMISARIAPEGLDDRSVLKYKVKIESPLEKTMKLWCHHQGISMKQVIFFCDKRALVPNDTPLALGWLPTLANDDITIRGVLCSNATTTVSEHASEKRKRIDDQPSKAHRHAHVTKDFDSATPPPLALPPKQDGSYSSRLDDKSCDPRVSCTRPLPHKEQEVRRSTEPSCTGSNGTHGSSGHNTTK